MTPDKWPTGYTLVNIGTFKWTSDYSWMRTLTCRNHPTGYYLTKNPWNRGLHFIHAPRGLAWECLCPFGDLVVVCDANGVALGKPDYADPITDAMKTSHPERETSLPLRMGIERFCKHGFEVANYECRESEGK